MPPSLPSGKKKKKFSKLGYELDKNQLKFNICKTRNATALLTHSTQENEILIILSQTPVTLKIGQGEQNKMEIRKARQRLLSSCT